MRIFTAYQPPQNELEEARSRIGRADCPRRYCWWWHSLSFDFDRTPSDGCRLAEEWRRQYIKGGPVCCRASNHQGHRDYYEPREPHLKEDGFPEGYFLMVGKRYRRREFLRRQTGKQRAQERSRTRETDS